MIRAVTVDDLDDPAGLLASRHRAHRRRSPLLDPGYEDAAVCRELLADQLADGVTGVLSQAGDRGPGCRRGGGDAGAAWGPNIWMDSTAVCAPDAETLRDLYAVAADGWVA